jgi:hypothetical protein
VILRGRAVVRAVHVVRYTANVHTSFAKSLVTTICVFSFIHLWCGLALDLIPSNDKVAYLEAKQQRPRLVETEPGLLRFLEYE